MIFDIERGYNTIEEKEETINNKYGNNLTNTDLIEPIKVRIISIFGVL